MKPVIIIVIAVVLLIPIPVFAPSHPEFVGDNQFSVNLILVSLDCSYSIHGSELVGLIEITYLYLWSFNYPSEINGYCVTPNEFDDVLNYLDMTYEEIIIVMFNFEYY